MLPPSIPCRAHRELHCTARLHVSTLWDGSAGGHGVEEGGGTGGREAAARMSGTVTDQVTIKEEAAGEGGV